jgi:hypothetical protein
MSLITELREMHAAAEAAGDAARAARIRARIHSLTDAELADDGACCRVEENLIARNDPERPEVTIRVCRQCRRRHIVATLDPGRIAATGAGIGR